MASFNSGNLVTGNVEQWASKVIRFSSEYDSCGWSASDALGAPRVYPRYGDNRGTWAQGNCDSEEYIELEYITPVYVSAINIYETYNCGGVRRISLKSPRGSWDTVWETDTVQRISVSRIFTPEIKCPSYRTKAVRLDIDCTVAETWVEIDAVQLVGRKFKFDVPPPLSAVLEDFAKLVNDKESADVFFSVQSRTIYAHRAILSVRSQKLKDMMVNTSQGCVIPVEDISYDAFLGVLHYIYSGCVPSTEFGPDMLVELWRAACKLKMDGLRAYCLMMIEEKINANNVIDVFTNASDKEPVSDDIREVCLEFLSSNLGAVSLTPQFKELSQPQIVEIVQLTTSRLSLE